MAEKSNVPYDTISRLSVSTQSIFTKCCCCVPLRLGCFILGYLHLTISAFQSLGLLALTAFIGMTTHGFDHFDVERPDQDSDTLTISKVQVTPAQIGFVLAILLVINLSWMAIHIACLVGLHKKRPGHIRVYVGFASARLILALAGFINMMMTNRSAANSIIIHTIDLGLAAYFILVYYIYAVQLERARDEEIVQSAPVSKEFIYPTKLDKSHLVA